MNETKIDETMAQRAERLFNAYNAQGPNPWKTFDGRDVPRWSGLSDQVRAKWLAAAAESLDNATVERIAMACHEVNRAYCAALGDLSQLPWDHAPEWQKESARNGVRYHLQHADSTPADSHNSWLHEKAASGWKWGAVKDPEKKEHPCFLPYEKLPPEQKAKDFLFMAVVRSLQR